jgi:hypothetical protein
MPEKTVPYPHKHYNKVVLENNPYVNNPIHKSSTMNKQFQDIEFNDVEVMNPIRV